MSGSAELIALLTERKLRIAVAESLTGGLLISELINTPGASAVVLGGVVAYNTELKRSVLGVDAAVLNVHGAVHPDVAIQMAVRVREVLAVDGLPAEIGVATTGVAGPESQDGVPPGTAYLAIAVGSDVRVKKLSVSGDRNTIRAAVVAEAISELSQRVHDSR